MKAKELNIEHKEKTQEDIAKKVIEDLYQHVDSCKKELAEAEKKLSEALEKDIEDIKEEDAKHWNW